MDPDFGAAPVLPRADPGAPVRRRRKPQPAEPFPFQGINVYPGSHRAINFPIGEFYTLAPAYIPVTIYHGETAGPIVFVSAAIHGDELNGIEIVRRLIYEVDWSGLCGTLVLMPVVNLFAFMQHSRELPDGRDLNRMFPGSPRGSSAMRVAHHIYNGIIKRCNFGIDLHTAGAGRTNYPHIRADMSDPRVARLARAFGADLIMDGITIPDSLRGTACREGIPTVTFEGGEHLKFQRPIIDEGVTGVRNMLISLGMLQGVVCRSRRPLIFKRTKWIRADRGGLVELIANPGQFVREGQLLAHFHTPFGREVDSVVAPFDCIIIGATTIPTLYPGDPIYNVGRVERRARELIEHPLPPRL